MNTPPEDSNIARRTVRGSAYSVGASAITIVLGIVRTYLMVTYLLPAEVGLAALGLFWVDLVSTFSATGLSSAFIHRRDADEETRRNYFTFSLLIGLAAFLVTLLLIPILVPFYPQYGGLGWIILAYAAIGLFKVYNQPQVTFLNKDLAFDQIARLDVAGAAAATVVGPLMAAAGFGVWALVGEYAAGLASRFLLLQFGFPSWRPRLGWDRDQVSWFWDYGKSVWMSSNLTFAIDNFDDFWVGTVLGKTPLGFYNKAYEFSRYPRRVVAGPILSVFFPAFALLQGDRTRLSRAFFRSASLMVRTSALFSLLIILTAPEIFALFLPEVWQPMLVTFQLMIVYTILDPLSLAANQLLLATGHPKTVTRIRWLQIVVFVPAVVAGAAWLGIEGVALAADLMMLVGVWLLYRAARLVVDFSALALWRWPILAAGLVAAATLGVGRLLEGIGPAWLLAVKAIAISGLFGLILYLTEREQLLSGARMIWGLVKPQKKMDQPDEQSDDRRP